MSDTIRLNITGMTCNHCVMRAQKALEGVEGVEKAEVTLEPGQATVTGSADPSALISAVRNAGYEASQ